MRKLVLWIGLALVAAIAGAQYAVVSWEPVEGADGYVIWKWDGAAMAFLDSLESGSTDTVYVDTTVAEDDSTWYRVAAYASGEFGAFTDSLWAYADLAATVDTTLTVFASGAVIDTMFVDWTPVWASEDWTATELHIGVADSIAVWRRVLSDEVWGSWAHAGDVLHPNVPPFADVDSNTVDEVRYWSAGDTLQYYAETHYTWPDDGYGVAYGDTAQVVAATSGISVAGTRLYFSSTGDGRIYQIAVYDSERDLIATAAQCTTSGTGAQTLSATFSEAFEIDADSTYYIVLLPVSAGGLSVLSGENLARYHNGSGAFTDPLPSPGTNWNNGGPCVWLVDSEGDYILGVSDTADCSGSASPSPDYIHWTAAGYSTE